MASSLTCETRTYAEQSHTHFHSYHQLILPLQGKMMIQTENHRLTLDENHIFFVPLDCSHAYYGTYQNRFLVLDIPKELGALAWGEQRYREQLQACDEKWRSLRYLIIEEMKRQNKKALNHLAGYALELLGEAIQPPSIQYIHEHLDQNLQLSQLAALENYQESYYIQWFRRRTGMTPNAYIQALRLERAKHYLAHTEMSLLQIAELLGYEQQSSLTRLFKARLSLSPSEYRKDCQVQGKREGPAPVDQTVIL